MINRLEITEPEQDRDNALNAAHPLRPLRKTFPGHFFSLIAIEQGQPRISSAGSTDPQPDLTDWNRHPWTSIVRFEGEASLAGWSFSLFGCPVIGAIAIRKNPDTTSQADAVSPDEIVDAYARLFDTSPPHTVARTAFPVAIPDDLPTQSSQIAPDHAGLLGFFLWDSLSGRLTGDPHLAVLTGIPAEKLQRGIPWARFLEVIREEDRPDPHEKAHDWLAQTRHRGVRVLHANGHVARLHISAQNHGDGCTGTVIALNREDRIASHAGQAFINSMLVSSNDCVKILTLDGIITFVNQGAVIVLNLCSPDEMMGLYWPDVWTDSGRRLSEKAIIAAREGKTSHFQDYIEATDGRRRLWDVVVTPILGPDGKPERLLGISRDMAVANQEHERLELALQAGTITGMWLWDSGRKLVTGDVRMAATLGLSHGALGAGLALETVLDRITPEDRPVIRTAISDALRGDGRFRCEFRLVDDGTRTHRWVEANGTCSFDPDGGISHFPGILFDIDARKRQTIKREALVLFGDGLRSLDNQPDILALCSRTLGETIETDYAGFAEIDPEGELALLSCVWHRDLNAPRLDGLYAFRSFGSYIDQLARGEVVAISDVATDPRTAPFADSFAALRITALLNVPVQENGVLQGVAVVHLGRRHQWDEIAVSFVRTVADRTWAAIRQIRAQEALRRMNETLEEQVLRRTRERDRLWAISADLLALMDHDGRIRYLNPSWTQSFGPQAADWIGNRLDRLVHPADMDRAAEAIEMIREGRLDQGVDLRFWHQSGQWHTFNWSGSVEGEEIYLIGRDVTERIALEDQLRQSQKMEAVGQLTGGLAHDFNNILAGIGGALGLLSRRLEQGRTTGLERYITAAQGATDRAAALTHRLLAFSRRQTLDPQLADVNVLILGMENLLEGTIGPNIILEFALEPGLGVTLVDTNQLENALLNLSINARDAMPEGGHLQICTARTSLDASEAGELGLRAGDYIVLDVCDTGVGMNADVVARAFDPFFTTKPIGKGTGLGLSMIYGFARQSGGRVAIDSTPGKGTMVHLWLPAHSPTDLPALPPHQAVTGVDTLANLRVLLVDDEETLRFTVRETLQDWGATVQEAADGTAALAFLNDRERLFDVLITDVGLPGGLNGRQLADAACVLRPELGVLFITGYAEQAIFARDPSDAKMHILPKPFTPAMLDEKLRNVVRNLVHKQD